MAPLFQSLTSISLLYSGPTVPFCRISPAKLTTQNSKLAHNQRKIRNFFSYSTWLINLDYRVKKQRFPLRRRVGSSSQGAQSEGPCFQMPLKPRSRHCWQRTVGRAPKSTSMSRTSKSWYTKLKASSSFPDLPISINRTLIFSSHTISKHLSLTLLSYPVFLQLSSSFTLDSKMSFPGVPVVAQQ